MKRGFTIIELMAAIVVITVGILGTYTIVQQIFLATSNASQRLSAGYLAQEGVENVRNIRDTNWIEGEAWNNGIGNLSESNLLSIYGRSTTISTNPDGSLKVSVQISWTRRGQGHTLTVQENIYDWK